MLSLSSNLGPLVDVASMVVPVACQAEVDGTFVNAQGLAQRFTRAIEPPEGIGPAWQTIGTLAQAMGKTLGFHHLSDLRQAMPAAYRVPQLKREL
jgi:NADH dehydrogenase/NADH:ubiquinone oxidoreductase subunit G